jgi:hypothetical protein
MPEPNLLEAMKAVEAAGDRASPRPWAYDMLTEAISSKERKEGCANTSVASLDAYWENDRDGHYIALAAKHAPEFIKAIRALRKVARAARRVCVGGVFDAEGVQALRDAFREFESGPYAGLLEGDD